MNHSSLDISHYIMNLEENLKQSEKTVLQTTISHLSLTMLTVKQLRDRIEQIARERNEAGGKRDEYEKQVYGLKKELASALEIRDRYCKAYLDMEKQALEASKKFDDLLASGTYVTSLIEDLTEKCEKAELSHMNCEIKLDEKTSFELEQGMKINALLHTVQDSVVALGMTEKLLTSKRYHSKQAVEVKKKVERVLERARTAWSEIALEESVGL